MDCASDRFPGTNTIERPSPLGKLSSSGNLNEALIQSRGVMISFSVLNRVDMSSLQRC